MSPVHFRIAVLYYTGMRDDRKKAIKLRRLGKSYSEIRHRLGIPMPTLSDWFSRYPWSKTIKQTLNNQNQQRSKVRIIRLNKVRGVHLARLYEEARREAKSEFEILKYDPLFIAGVVVYWGEGDKVSKNGFRITNSDSRMILVFKKFLQTICGAESSRIRVSLLLYPDINDSICRSYWEKEIGLSNSNFTKSTVIQRRHQNRRLKYGVCTLNFSSRYLKEKMLIWIKLLSGALVGEYIKRP